MNHKPPKFKNPLEALRELGKETLRTMEQELIKPIPNEIVEQFTGKKSGEIQPGQSIEINQEKRSANTDKNEYYQRQFILEKQLIEEDKILVEKRTNELRIQIQAIQQEVYKLTEVTPNLSQELQIAAFNAGGDVSEYELNFLEHLFQAIKSFRKRIENAHIWLSSANTRASKKNVWGTNYKRHGAKYLLSGEHYASRSAA